MNYIILLIGLLLGSEELASSYGSLSGTSCRSRGGVCALGDGSLERSIALEFELSGDTLFFVVSRAELSAEYQQDLLGGLLDSGDSLHFAISENLFIDSALCREIGCSKPSLVIESGLYPVQVFSDHVKGVFVIPNTHE